MATAAKPIRRSTADRLVNEFLSRVEKVNGEPSFLYEVRKATIFGSYLTDAEELGDVDIAVELASKIADKHERQRQEDAKIHEARAQGRSFSNMVAELFWPYVEVMRFLRARSGYLSLHAPDDGVLEIVPVRRVIYDVARRSTETR